MTLTRHVTVMVRVTVTVSPGPLRVKRSPPAHQSDIAPSYSEEIHTRVLTQRTSVHELRFSLRSAKREPRASKNLARPSAEMSGDEPQQRVALVGSGNWGSAIARLVGDNVRRLGRFHPAVRMWVFDELVSVGGVDTSLVDVINTTHINAKYLPGFELPHNVRAVRDLAEAVEGATLLVFVLPHQFLSRALPVIRAALGTDALASGRVRALSLIKGIDVEPQRGGLGLISHAISAGLAGARCDVLMGANVASEVASGQFCEATVGTRGPAADAEVWCELLRTRFFGVRVCADGDAVELCGALKNVVALSCGFALAQGLGTNTLAALIRIGAGEMLHFIRAFHDPTAAAETLLESCGVADLITSCFGGRNAKCAEAFVRTGRDWAELERELLDGQKLQGTLTCSAVQRVLQRAGCPPGDFPLFSTTHAIMVREAPPSALVEMHERTRLPAPLA